MEDFDTLHLIYTPFMFSSISSEQWTRKCFSVFMFQIIDGNSTYRHWYIVCNSTSIPLILYQINGVEYPHRLNPNDGVKQALYLSAFLHLKTDSMYLTTLGHIAEPKEPFKLYLLSCFFFCTAFAGKLQSKKWHFTKRLLGRKKKCLKYEHLLSEQGRPSFEGCSWGKWWRKEVQ